VVYVGGGGGGALLRRLGVNTRDLEATDMVTVADSGG
jgi:hypothetical protein